MSEEIKIIDGTYKKDDPHKDIGKQKFRVRKHYSVWVEYDVVAENRSEAESAVMEHGRQYYHWPIDQTKRDGVLQVRFKGG